jgi:PAS domain S-box-containing protein
MRQKIKNLFWLEYLDEQILEMLDAFNLSAIIVNLVIPFLIVVALWNTQNSAFLLCWFSLQVLIVLVRKRVGESLKQKVKSKKPYADILNLHLFIIFCSGLLWGSFYYYVLSHSSLEHSFLAISVLFAVSAGSILTLGPVFIAFVFFNFPMILGAVFGFDLSVNALFWIETILMLSFFFVTSKNAYKKHFSALTNAENLSLMHQYESITNLSGIVSKSDINGKITFANDNFCKISGYSKEELLGQSHNIIRHPDMPSITFKEMWNTIKKKKKTWHGIIKNRAKNGDTYYVSTTINPVLDKNGNILEYIALRHDISSIMSDKNQLFDYLEVNKLSVVIMIQIEDYDILEKLYVKATVEHIEKIFGDAILYLLPPTSCNFNRVYHLGNGLYALARDRRTCQKTQEELEGMLHEFLVNVKEYVIKLEKIEYDISAICSYTYGVIQTYEDAKIGIEKAIESKQSIVYADGLSGVEYALALQNIETLHTLKVALDDKKVISFFQPIINNTTKKVEKYEFLVRLITQEGEIISPFAFLDVAKKGRYYTQVTKIVLQNSFKTLRATDKEISMNLSTLDIENEDIQKLIFELLEEYQDVANRVVFELLESEDVKDFKTVTEFIKKVKPYGVKIAIDDFGSGYSNFERLLQYEPDILKIDGSLIKNILENILSKNIVETVVLFAEKQKIKTVAEFVENEMIFNAVKELGIDYSQGYAFGKPEDLFKE